VDARARDTRHGVPHVSAFAFGDLADLLMLDTRIEGRDQQVAREDIAGIERVSRQLLGTAQEEWLWDGLRDSTAAGKAWQILGQQVMFAAAIAGREACRQQRLVDGYRGARTRVFEAAAGAGVKHLVVLTGDVHSAWAYDLARDPFERAAYDPRTGKGAVGTEIVTPAVTSPGGPPPDRVAGLLDIAAAPQIRRRPAARLHDS
jgi:alkaline phosphatase D